MEKHADWGSSISVWWISLSLRWVWGLWRANLHHVPVTQKRFSGSICFNLFALFGCYCSKSGKIIGDMNSAWGFLNCTFRNVWWIHILTNTYLWLYVNRRGDYIRRWRRAEAAVCWWCLLFDWIATDSARRMGRSTWKDRCDPRGWGSLQLLLKELIDDSWYSAILYEHFCSQAYVLLPVNPSRGKMIREIHVTKNLWND